MSKGSIIAYLVAAVVITDAPAVAQQSYQTPIPLPAPSPAPRSNRITYGAWAVENVQAFSAAYTHNESDSVFGMMCGTNCVVYVNAHIPCTEGHTYPVMINSPVGASNLSMRCVPIEGRYVLVTPLDDDFVQIFSATAGEVGFAIPLASGRFAVSRYSLSGALEATAAAASEAHRRRDAGQSGLRDFTI